MKKKEKKNKTGTTTTGPPATTAPTENSTLPSSSSAAISEAEGEPENSVKLLPVKYVPLEERCQTELAKIRKYNVKVFEFDEFLEKVTFSRMVHFPLF